MANEITELPRRDRKRDMDRREDLEQVFFTKSQYFNLHKPNTKAGSREVMLRQVLAYISENEIPSDKSGK
jgi:hypothetical protein